MIDLRKDYDYHPTARSESRSGVTSWRKTLRTTHPDPAPVDMDSRYVKAIVYSIFFFSGFVVGVLALPVVHLITGAQI